MNDPQALPKPQRAGCSGLLFIIGIMKLNGILGTGTGKLGSSVFASVGGKQVVRQYQPQVSNPSTVKQVDQRARLKLMSQLAATLAPCIVIPKEGTVSSRNKFISKNFDFAIANNGVAQISYENVQLTNGTVGLPAIVAQRSVEGGLEVALDGTISQTIARVVYNVFKKDAEQNLLLVKSVVEEQRGNEDNFEAALPYEDGELVIYAYGISDTSEKATAKYGDLNVQSGVDIATLVMNRAMTAADYRFTKTRGATMFANEDEISAIPDGYARVYVTTSGPGSATGAGVFEIGSQVTVVASIGAGAAFVGWKRNGSETILSTNPSYTFELASTTDLVAVFRDTTNDRTVTLSAQGITDAQANLQGAGVYSIGEQVTVSAAASYSDMEFAGWKVAGAGENDPYVSQSRNYTFTLSDNTNLVAVYQTGEGGSGD